MEGKTGLLSLFGPKLVVPLVRMMQDKFHLLIFITGKYQFITHRRGPHSFISFVGFCGRICDRGPLIIVYECLELNIV